MPVPGGVAFLVGLGMVVLGVGAGSPLCWGMGLLVFLVQLGAEVTILCLAMRKAGPHKRDVAQALVDCRFVSWPARTALRRLLGLF